MKTILLVEDDTDHAELMRRALEDAGHGVSVAGSLAEARAVLAQAVPVLALVDHHLPDGGGCELIAAIAGASPILLMTAHGDEQLAVDAIKAGAMDYLVKSPAMFAELPHTVERALREWGLELERRQMLRALHESEERYRRITEGLTDYLYSVRVEDGRAMTTTHNSACVAVTGYTAAELAADPFLWMDMIVEEDRARVIAHVQRVLAGERLPPVEHRIVRKDGVTRWVSDKSILHLSPAGRLIGYDGVIRDITERKEWDEGMRQSEERYRTVVELCPEAVFVHSGGRVVFANRAAAVLIGAKSAADLIGIGGLSFVEPEFHAAIERRMKQLVAVGHVAPFTQERWRRFDGTLVEVMVVATQLRFNALPATLVMAMDVTAQRQAEAALAASEQRFRSLVESVPNIAVQGYDPQRRVVFWNAASEALYGYSRAEALGRPLEDLIIPPEMRAGVIAAVAGLTERNEPIPAGERVLRRKDGSAVSVYSSHVKLERPDGGCELHCIDIDLTARKAAERALAESHEFHMRILSQVPALIWRAGTDAKCDWFSDRWLEFTGRTMAQEVGDGWLEAVHPDDVAGCVSTYLAAFGARRAFEMEYRLRRADGEYRMIADRGRPFETPSGEFGGFIGYCSDITERREADERIREQAALLDAAQDAIMVTDQQRTVTYWNHAAEQMYEVPAREAYGRPFEELVYRKLPDGFEEEWARLLREGTWSGERPQLSRSGRPLHVRIKATVVRNPTRGTNSVLMVISDITESKKLEAQFLRARRLESLGALASGVAHDLNNVLAPMLMAVELLRPLARDQDDHDMLQLLNDSARRGADIVQQLLLFGRGSDSPRAPLNAADVVKDVVKMMRQTFPKDLVLSLQVAADLWLVEADRTQIHQVLLNLCVNARDAMPHGGRLGVVAENRQVTDALARSNGGTGGGAYVLLQVRDSGKGIPAADLDKIFDPFFTTKPIGEGTGLGLPTVLGIVRSHGGFLTVTSEPGSGAVFEVYLPAAKSAVATAAGPKEKANLAGRGECLLVVEDEEGIRSVLQRLFTGQNYQVLMASDGAEALGIFAQNASKVKLVVTDVMMPVMNGSQMVSALRRLNPALPVVAVSGLPAHRAEFEKKFGPRIRFLPKPFTTELALQTVREALDEAASPTPTTRS